MSGYSFCVGVLLHSESSINSLATVQLDMKPDLPLNRVKQKIERTISETTNNDSSWSWFETNFLILNCRIKMTFAVGDAMPTMTSDEEDDGEVDCQNTLRSLMDEGADKEKLQRTLVAVC